MARFRGTVQGGRGGASRLGHWNTGLATECNGWDVGIRCETSNEGDEPAITHDVVRAYATGGSNRASFPNACMEVHETGLVTFHHNGNEVYRVEPTTL